MDHHNFAVTALLDIDFDHVRSILDGLAYGSECILGRLACGSPVSDNHDIIPCLDTIQEPASRQCGSRHSANQEQRKAGCGHPP